MTFKKDHLTIHGISIDVVWKRIKNFNIRIYPPDGRVRVAAPLRLSGKAVHQAIIARLDWIKKHQSRLQLPQHQARLEMVTGEIHLYQGRRYRLEIIEHNGPTKVRFGDNATLELMVRPGTDRDKREAVLNQWYREQLRQSIPLLISQWGPMIGVSVADWGIKKMKTRWGTCNIRARRIWINLELAKKKAELLEYVVVHEMTHLLEGTHNATFKTHLDRFIPQWHQYRAELKRSAIGT